VTLTLLSFLLQAVEGTDFEETVSSHGAVLVIRLYSANMDPATAALSPMDLVLAIYWIYCKSCLPKPQSLVALLRFIGFELGRLNSDIDS